LLERAPKELEAARRFFDTGKKPKPKAAQRRFVFKLYRDPAVRAALNELFHHKCAYCESRYGATAPLAVTHFRPKERALDHDGTVAPLHYWWLAADWTNLLAACIDCDRNKGTRFPVGARRAEPLTVGPALRRERPLLLDPCHDRPEKHLVFSEDGAVQSNTARGRTTIELLGLNRVGLVTARRRAYELLRVQLARSEQLFRLMDEDPENDLLREQVETELGIVRGYLDPGQEYAGLHRQFVNRWLQELDLDLARPLAREAARKTVLVSTKEEQETAASFREHAARQQSYSVEAEDSAHKETFYSGAKRIEWIEIQNFRAIEKLELPFPAARSEQEAWLMVLGDNGTGKSSILQAVALTLMGEAHARELRLDASTFVRRDAKRGSGRVRVQLTNIPEPLTLRFRRSSQRFDFDTPDPKVLLLGYGATRLLRPQTGPDQGPGYIRVKNLFDPTAQLDDVEGWLLDRTLVRDELFETIATALRNLLMLDERCRMRRVGNAVEVTLLGEEPVPLRQLSDGFQSMVALCADIMKSLLERWPSMEDAEGVVLLDEVEAHLHPTWKIEIVERLRRTFPRVAFLVSTHDPLCLKGLHEGEIGVLRRDEQRKISIRTDVPPVNDWRADQILTSPLFGLHSTRGDETTDAIGRYAELLGKRRRTPEQQRELELLRRRLAPTLSERETERQRRVEDVLWQVLVAREPSSAIASWTKRSRADRAPTAEVLELRRQLGELLGPRTTP
jgi:uncharacterized protein (TIGR02646 family)